MLLPFQLSKWVVMGFAWFLASLDEGGRYGLNLPDTSGRSGSGPTGSFPPWVSEATSWIQVHLAIALAVGAAGLLLVTAISSLILWVCCRGKFVFLDNVATNQASVTEPWNRLREQGNSLFWTKFLLGATGTCLLLAALGAGLAMTWNDLLGQRYSTPAVLIVAAAVGLLGLFVAVCLGVLSWLLDDFAVILMYRHQERAWPALRRVVRELVRPHFWSLVLFALMKLALGLAIGVCVVLLTCLTCCLAGLPYVSSVVFLPVGVFMRCYSLFFAEQLGADWTVVQPLLPEPPDRFDRWARGTVR